MTVYELQNRFNQEMEKYKIMDPVMSSVVEDYINYAYQSYVTEKYDSLVNPMEKFELTERLSQILAPLLDDFSTTIFTSITTNSPDGYYCTGPATLQYIVSESAVINTLDCDGFPITKNANIIPFKHNMISPNKDNPFLKPIEDEIWRLNITSKRIELLLGSGDTLASYTCRYLKKITPVSFSVGTTIAIDDSVHEEIVVRAVYMYLGNLGPQDQKQQKQKQTQDENA